MFEYSDHSSYTEILDCVKLLKPKKIFPVVQDQTASGFMKDWPQFHVDRVNLSPLNRYLSKLPEKILGPVPKFRTPAPCFFAMTGKRRQSGARIIKEYIYRGPKGAVYDTTSESGLLEDSPAKQTESNGIANEAQGNSDDNGGHDGTRLERTAKRPRTQPGESGISRITRDLTSAFLPLFDIRGGVSKNTVKEVNKALEEVELILDLKSNKKSHQVTQSGRFTQFYNGTT